MNHPELAEMLDDFDAYIGELFISVDKVRERAEEYITALSGKWRLGGTWFSAYQRL